LAHHLIVMCGSMMLPWDILPIALSFLSQTKMVKQLDDLGLWALRRDWTYKLTRRKHEAGMRVFPPIDGHPLQNDQLPKGNLTSRIAFVSGIHEARRVLRTNLVLFGSENASPTISEEDWTKSYLCLEDLGLYRVRIQAVDGSVSLLDLLRQFRHCDS